MTRKLIKKVAILGVLFFLPVIFLLFLYPSTHNYNTLDIVNDNVLEVSDFVSDTKEAVALEDHITVLGFFGEQPMDIVIAASNLKELVYDKFQGFKRFQIVILVPNGVEEQVKLLKQELVQQGELKYWHFLYGHKEDIKKVFYSLKSSVELDANLATENIFIIDKDKSQRGRIDDRTDKEIEKNSEVYGLNAYNCIEVAVIKNKMSEDVRILFTEYRQKRKGNFDSTTRRAEDIKSNEKK